MDIQELLKLLYETLLKIARPGPCKSNLKSAVSIYEKLGERDERGTAHQDFTAFVNDAVKEHRVISYNKEMSDSLPVIAQLAWLGNITAPSLNKNLTQFRKEVKECSNTKKKRANHPPICSDRG